MFVEFRQKRTFLGYLVTYSLGGILAALAPFLLAGAEMGALDRKDFVSAGLLFSAFAVSAGFASLLLTFRKQLSGPALLAIIGGGYAVALFLVLTNNPTIPANLAGMFIVSGIVILLLPLFISGHWLTAAMGLAAAGVVFLLVPDMRQVASRAGASASSAQFSVIDTQLHEVQATTYRGFVPRARRGGAITRMGNDFLLALGTGELFRLNLDSADGRLDVTPMEIPSPLADEAFDRDVPPAVDRLKFRVNDVFVRESGPDFDIFVSHHHWYADDACFVLRLSHMSTRGNTPQQDDWRNVYETEPCLPLKSTGHPFAGHQAGGRIVNGDNGRLLMTVGDHEFDGHYSEIKLPQDPDNDYGKVIEIDPETGNARTFSIGHRNPQGLVWDADGRLWSTEHGPRGGDELNLIVEGQDYGWPQVTYGTSYGGISWPQNPAQGRHDGFEEPVFAWLPSVGISSLIQIDGSRFPLWQGDLLVSSMRANTLYRVRTVDERVVFVEPFDVGTRVRDLALAEDGSVVLWTDRSDIVHLTTSDEPTTMSVFTRYCSGCHAVADGTLHGIGPDLANLMGADAAQSAGYEFSAALTESGLTWDQETLDRYLQNPQELVPGTTMSFPGIPDATERAEIIRHLSR